MKIKNTSMTMYLLAVFCHSHAWAKTFQQSAPVQGDQCAPDHLSTVEHWNMMDAVEAHTAHTQHTYTRNSNIVVNSHYHAMFLMLIQKLIFTNKTLLLLLLLLLQPFYDPLSATTQVSQYQKDKPLWILLKQTWWCGSGISWTICKLFALRSRR